MNSRSDTQNDSIEARVFVEERDPLLSNSQLDALLAPLPSDSKIDAPNSTQRKTMALSNDAGAILPGLLNNTTFAEGNRNNSV